jgi:hypothetical protein
MRSEPLMRPSSVDASKPRKHSIVLLRSIEELEETTKHQ